VIKDTKNEVMVENTEEEVIFVSNDLFANLQSITYKFTMVFFATR